MVTDKASAVLSTVEVAADDVATNDPAFVSKSKNIALYRPCQPSRFCEAIVDNNRGSSAALESKHYNPLERIANTFQIFLQQRIAISDVIVVCSTVPSQVKPLSGTLLVTISSAGLEGDNNTGVLYPTKMVREITVQNQSEVVFRIEDIGSTISIEWRSQDHSAASDTTLQINEVMVMTSNTTEEPLAMTGSDAVAATEGADIMRIKSFWAKLSHLNDSELVKDAKETNLSSHDVPSSEEILEADGGEEAHTGLVLNASRKRGAIFYKRARTTSRPKSGFHADTTLAPGIDSGMLQQIPFMQVRNNVATRWEQVKNAQKPGILGVTSLGFDFHVPVILAVVLIGAVVVLHGKLIDCQFCFRHKYQLAPVEDPEAALSDSDGSSPEHGRAIGRQTLATLRCARRLRFLQRTPPTTESEPEEESEPLIPADAPEQATFEPRSISADVASATSSTAPVTRAESLHSRRVVLLYASPLCHISQGRPHPIAQIPFEKEWAVMLRAHDEAKTALRMSATDTVKRQPGACLEAQPLTAASLRCLVAASPDPTRGGSAAILHLSAHGMQDRLVVENGKTTAHTISSDLLQSMLADNAVPAKLVVLNACSLKTLGDTFVNGGVPHVICSSAELRDSASHVFLCAMYSSLFQGGTVAHAFRSAIVALRSDPEEPTRAAADFFHLLPEQAAHNEVIFQPEIVTMPKSSRPALAPPLQAALLPPSSSLDRESSGGSGGKSTTCAGSSLSSDVTESSTDGPDESCYSEGHVDTSSNSGSRASSDSEDSHGSVTEKTSLLFSNSASGPILPIVAPRRPRVSTAPVRCSANTIPVSRNRLSRNNLACKRRLPARRSLPSGTLTQHEALLSPLGRAVPPLPDDFIGRSIDVWEVLQHLCDRRAVVVCGAPGTTHGVGKSALLDAIHRSFAFQMGGVCIPVHLRALCNADVASVASTWEWMEKVKACVQFTFDEYLELGRHASTDQKSVASTVGKRSCMVSGVCNGSALTLRRRMTARSGVDKACRSVSRGFHSLSDPIATRPVLEELVAAMSSFAEYCEERNRSSPASATPGVKILLLLDECDHLIQQRHFQDAIAEVLKQCAAYRVVLSTQQQMVQTGGGWFKVVHKQVAGLSPKDAARFFLRRSDRPLYWDELPAISNESNMAVDAGTMESCADGVTPKTPTQRQQVKMTRENEAEVLARVAAHPVVAAQQGNPRRLLEIASQVRDSLEKLSDLAAHR